MKKINKKGNNNMKKILVAILVVIMTTTLVACNRPTNMTDATYKNGCHALEIMDKYNSAEISREEAKDRLDSIKKEIDKEQFSENAIMESTNNLIISNIIFMFTISFDGGVSSTYEEADELREMLGK